MYVIKIIKKGLIYSMKPLSREYGRVKGLVYFMKPLSREYGRVKGIYPMKSLSREYGRVKGLIYSMKPLSREYVSTKGLIYSIKPLSREYGRVFFFSCRYITLLSSTASHISVQCHCISAGHQLYTLVAGVGSLASVPLSVVPLYNRMWCHHHSTPICSYCICIFQLSFSVC